MKALTTAASGIRHTAGVTAEATLVAVIAAMLLFALAPVSAPANSLAGTGTVDAARGGSHGTAAAATAACVVDDTSVTGSGLPTDEVLNFFVTNASGRTGWVLGFTSSGTWWEPVPDRAGPTTYEFASKTWGPMGSKYTVFASCSAG